jgi:uncharacterized RDD family membrane protein YckC
MIDENWDLAGFGDRWVGDVCDGLISIVVALAGYLVIDRWILGHQTGFLDEKAPIGADIFWWAWFLWNFTYLVGRTGQSSGRRMVGLKVVDSEGDPIGFWRSLGRNLFAIFISAPVFYLGFLWVFWDPCKQAWHDKVFRTFVLRRVGRSG